MSKEKTIYDLTGVNPVAVITKSLNKKGHLRGDKKEVRRLKSICTHHALTRNGKKVKRKIHPVGNKMCQCKTCKEMFRLNYYSEEEYDKAYEPMKEILSQSKFIAQAIGADRKTLQIVCENNLRMDDFHRIYKNLAKIGKKKDKQRDKKDRKKESNSSIGGWSIRN